MSHPPLPFVAVVVRLFVLRPADPNRASGEGRDGSDPPVCAAGAARRRVGVSHGVRHRVRPPPRLRGGRSRLYVSLREGSSARTRAGRRAATSGAMLDRFIRAFLVVGGVSVACAWTWPGAFPEADPVAVLVRYHTPNVYRAVVAWYYVAPGVAVFLAGQLLISTSRIWFARMGVTCGAPVPPSDVAAFAYGGRAGDRRRRGPSPGQSHREPGPRMADDPGAWPLYRRGDFRRGRVRQDVGLYAPVRAHGQAHEQDPPSPSQHRHAAPPLRGRARTPAGRAHGLLSAPLYSDGGPAGGTRAQSKLPALAAGLARRWPGRLRIGGGR